MGRSISQIENAHFIGSLWLEMAERKSAKVAIISLTNQSNKNLLLLQLTNAGTIAGGQAADVCVADAPWRGTARRGLMVVARPGVVSGCGRCRPGRTASWTVLRKPDERARAVSSQWYRWGAMTGHYFTMFLTGDLKKVMTYYNDPMMLAGGRAVSRAEAEPTMAKFRDDTRARGVTEQVLDRLEVKMLGVTVALVSFINKQKAADGAHLERESWHLLPQEDRRRLEDHVHQHLSPCRFRQARLSITRGPSEAFSAQYARARARCGVTPRLCARNR